MPRIPGYNYNIHLEDGFDCCEAELAILKNQTVPAKLDNLESIEDAGDNSYVFVDDGGTKKKVLLKDLINSSLNPQLAEITRRLDVHRDRLDRDRALEWVQLNALKKLTKTKQDKLVAGDGIKIDGNTISATVALDPEALKNLVTKEDFDKYSDYIESILVSTNDKLDALSDWLTEVDENKQDKLIAGENITIDENNVISAKGCDCKECTIGVDFITSNEIGKIPAGTEISADTTLSELIKLMLESNEDKDKVEILYGAVEYDSEADPMSTPTSVSSLQSLYVPKNELLSSDGIIIKMPAVTRGRLVIACESIYDLSDWINLEGVVGPVTFGFESVGTEPTYHLYYFGVPDVKKKRTGLIINEDSKNYQFKFGPVSA